jgi:hypothetical protein
MSGRNWTPYDVEIMLHHYCGPSRFPRWTASAYEGAVSRLIDAGLLRMDDAPDDGSDDRSHVFCTDLGASLIEMWLGTPMPRQIIIDPRDGKEILREFG